MTVHEIAKMTELETVQLEEDRQAECVFCCDMLSIAMARAPEDSVWVTVMGNKNVIAVASLMEMSAVIIPEGIEIEAPSLAKAREEGITVLSSGKTAFELCALMAAAGLPGTPREG